MITTQEFLSFLKSISLNQTIFEYLKDSAILNVDYQISKQKLRKLKSTIVKKEFKKNKAGSFYTQLL